MEKSAAKEIEIPDANEPTTSGGNNFTAGSFIEPNKSPVEIPP